MQLRQHVLGTVLLVRCGDRLRRRLRAGREDEAPLVRRQAALLRKGFLDCCYVARGIIDHLQSKIQGRSPPELA